MAATKNARDIFLDALDRAPADRAAYLDEACGPDVALRQRVDALLRANDDPGAFLSEVKPGAPEGTVDSVPGEPETDDHPDPTASVGAILAGKYKLVEEIGEGGMGSVFMAQQTEPVKRAVAVKVIKAGMDSKAVLARFEAERQALAMMDHPNIARVLDAGTTEAGRPFFVMELVKGTPITRYCDEHKLTPRQRLELFVPVCQAIQHAHQKGIIHRDIKPSNVLVAMYDDRAVPKVIDFGVAKAAGQSLTDKTLMTGFGAMVGTPEYMSPEQASLNNLDIDTRSDVYSLGVLLYELLTGTTPVDKKSLGKAALLEILRIVREVEAPRPSTKVSSIDTLPSVAANRGTEPARLSRLMRGELDWLVMKALEKDRTRRYETANALSRDIQRYLADEVVEARPPSVGYRVSKFVRRHKGRVIAAGLVLLALVGGIVGTTLGLFEARQQEEEARKQEKIARDETAEKDKALRAEAEARAGLADANKNLLNMGARALLRPLQPSQGPLNNQEIEPLWDLAATTDERLRLRFVETALDDPVLRRRLKNRALYAFQAAVGLDPTRRTRVEELLGKRLETREISAQEQEHVALCLAQLGGLDRRLTAKTANALLQAMSKTTDPNELQSLAQHLSALSARLEPKEAARLCGQAAATLLQAMSKTTDPPLLPGQPTWGSQLGGLAQGLSALSARLEPKEAAPLCGQAAAIVIQAMSKTGHPYALGNLAEGLSAVAAGLKPKEPTQLSRQATTTLIEVLSKTRHPYALGKLAEGLSAVAARLEPKEAAELAATLLQTMSKRRWDENLQAPAQGVSAVAAGLEPKEAAQVCGQAAAIITQAIRKETGGGGNPLGNLGEALSAVAARLEPKEATEVAATLSQAMRKAWFYYDLQGLAEALSAASAHLEPKEASPLCGQAAAILTQAISKATERYEVEALAKGLSALAAARLEPKEAAQVCRQAAAALTQVMSQTTDPYSLQYLAQRLSAASARLEPKEAAQVCGPAAATLTQAMSKTTAPSALGPLAHGLSAVSAGLEPKEAAELCGPAAATLIQAMSKTTDPNDLLFLAEGLSAVAARLEPKEAAELPATLIQAMSKTRSPLLVTDEAVHFISFGGRRMVLDCQFTELPQGLSAVLARELRPQTLVDLLKHPLCAGEARRLVLDALARHYHRPFADQWDFVDYVQQQKLGLDLTMPPVRENFRLVRIPAQLPAKRFAAILRGEDKPADNLGRLVFAQLAYDQKKFAVATRLWAGALASDPKLGENRRTQHRYNAACAAALAAAGQAQDEPPLDDAAKAKLRRQALDWLKTELAVWDKFVVANPWARKLVEQNLSHWQKDSDLAGIRDATALAKLPAEERAAFTTLWADVQNSLGGALASQNRVDEAIAGYKKAIAFDPKYALAHYNLGNALYGKGQLDLAIASYRKVTELDPKHSSAHNKLGAALSGKGQVDAAIACCKKAIAIDPNNAEAATTLADLLLRIDTKRWTVLKPAEMKSQGGATLTELADHSILAGGANPPSDQYTVTFIVPETMVIQSIRLEALTHDSLPDRGPGRSKKSSAGRAGMFSMIRWDLTAKGPEVTDSPRPLGFRSTSADLSLNLTLQARWDIWSDGGKNHAAVWSLLEPVTVKAGTALRSHMHFFHVPALSDQNLGRFRLSVSSDPAAFGREQERFTALKLTDPWAKLAVAYRVLSDDQAHEAVLQHHPQAASTVGDLHAAAQDWEGAIAVYRKLVTDQQADVALLTKLATAYQSAGCTRDALPYLAKASAANPKDTRLALDVAARQAWFGQEKELAATRQRMLAFAKGTNEAGTAERAAKVCSIRASADKAELEAAVAFGRTAVKLDKNGVWNVLALGMAEYRSGNDAAAVEALLSAAKADPNNPYSTGIAAFYRAMSLFRQGKKDEARKVAIAAAAQMKPLPKDEQNPLANGAYWDDLILWLAYKEAKAMIQFDTGPRSEAKPKQK